MANCAGVQDWIIEAQEKAKANEGPVPDVVVHGDRTDLRAPVPEKRLTKFLAALKSLVNRKD
jgi:hypothetical protein